VSPRPTDKEITEAHQYGVHKGKSILDVTGKFDDANVKIKVKILKDIYKKELHKSKITWLDIGCGHGEFMLALNIISDGHITVKGLEPNINKQQSAKKKKLDVSYFDIHDHDQKYDVISLLNVYSHLPNPPKFFKCCRNLLNPGGELLIQTGDAAHLSADEMYRPMVLPDHLSFTSEKILSQILERCGFKIINVQKYFIIPFNFFNLAKEIIKVVLPYKTSRMKYLFNAKYKTDMYIRARVVNLQMSPIRSQLY
jgi:2-polyprenyl-3-methyl-5-hydroxy-6-metoxy-1,4-benzoquinol methylase